MYFVFNLFNLKSQINDLAVFVHSTELYVNHQAPYLLYTVLYAGFSFLFHTFNQIILQKFIFRFLPKGEVE